MLRAQCGLDSSAGQENTVKTPAVPNIETEKVQQKQTSHTVSFNYYILHFIRALQELSTLHNYG